MTQWRNGLYVGMSFCSWARDFALTRSGDSSYNASLVRHLVVGLTTDFMYTLPNSFLHSASYILKIPETTIAFLFKGENLN